ncbi:MAG: hypothetical protein KKF85_04115 [Gammaproteobacteria bacterium]|nr:hypothetical protein [Gammaproteobacteria bacterium]MBU3990227.1 hypothetical protein [Gammaproteobacteria bacterium]MBU4004124.1 hypothetical protein [Gammaproteobacteria bacterium]MBU4020371.1 hypothetical protein [Gammaproteobacteria bacterium]MBU4095447.1 hypothetical protein [Gammaproteobacteria bacterium]
MFAEFIAWTTHLNETNRFAFALVTVALMAGVGITFAAIAEVVFKALGIKSGKGEHHH